MNNESNYEFIINEIEMHWIYDALCHEYNFYRRELGDDDQNTIELEKLAGRLHDAFEHFALFEQERDFKEMRLEQKAIRKMQALKPHVREAMLNSQIADLVEADYEQNLVNKKEKNENT
jgi:hypothetical protein